ncbi:MAG: Gfo/Idh/MocA family protein [Verrucomicrobiales bacterium]
MRVAGINFDHFHMGDLLRMVYEHPCAEIVGIADEQPDRMRQSATNFALAESQVYTNVERCLEEAKPEMLILCPAAARHAEWVERVAPAGLPILIEKPFAGTLAEADRMVAAMASTGQELAINWPLRWVASHVTAHRLIGEGRIGEVMEVHYYDGNRGPLWHGADKIENEPTAGEKAQSWFYKQAEGGGSLQDYLGYGTTLGTWFHGGRKPLEISCMVDEPDGLEVDEQSVTIARYSTGLSRFETRWGTFTDPWTHQPQPKCGFVIRGASGTISSFDYEPTVRVQSERCPGGEEVEVDKLEPPFANPVQYFIHCLENSIPVEGPLSPEMSRVGQQIVDTAVESAREGRTLPLIG